MSKKWGTRRTKIKEHLKKNKHLSFLGPFFLFSFSQIFLNASKSESDLKKEVIRDG